MKTWVTSDTHFGHQGVCQFIRKDGLKLRPWNDSKEMDAELTRRWNSVVAPEDKVYHLGDVSFHNRHMEILQYLNGRKVLIRGNHDTLKLSCYMKYFKDVRGSHVLNGYIMTHIPIHPYSKGRFKGNIHGHTHGELVHDFDKNVDPWYHNVCVENTDYTPLLLDSIIGVNHD